MTFRIIAAAVLFSAASVAQAGVINFSDTEFNPGDWSDVAQGSGISSTATLATGGNPGAYRRTATNGTGSVTLRAHLNFSSLAVYDPSAQGAILSIDYSEDVFSLDRQFTGLALQQNGRFYVRTISSGAFANWTTLGVNNIVAADFQEVVGTSFIAANDPDFSSTGSAITFGFFKANGGFGNASRRVGGTDNWSVTLNTATPVSEPGMLSLAAFGLLAAVRLRRRVRA